MTDIREDFIPWDIRYLRTRSYRRKSLIKKRLQVPCQVSHLYSVFNFSTLRESPWGQLSYINELKTYSLHKHDAIDIANPSSMQGACHLNFVIDLAHRTLCGSIIEYWSAESEGLRFDSSWGLRIFSLSHARDKTKKIFLYIFHYMISKIIHAFWLVLYSWAKTDAQMTSLLTTYRFHVTVGLYSTRSQEKSKFGKNISNTLDRTSRTPFLFLANVDVICVLILNRLTATWNVLVQQGRQQRIYLLNRNTLRRLSATSTTLVYTKTMDIVKGALWLATQAPNFIC